MPTQPPRHLLLVLNGKAAGDDAVRAAVAAADRLDGAPADGPRPADGTPAGEVVDLAAAAHARDLLRDQIRRQSLSARRGFAGFAEAMGMTSHERDSDPIGVALMRLEYDEALALLDARCASAEVERKDLSA